jgi:hypothetical protein
MSGAHQRRDENPFEARSLQEGCPEKGELEIEQVSATIHSIRHAVKVLRDLFAGCCGRLRTLAGPS